MTLLKNLHPPGLSKSLQNWTQKDLAASEVSKMNDKILTEKKKYPSLAVTGVVVDVNKKVDINFFYDQRKPRSVSDRIDDLIKSEKKKIRPKN